MVCWGVADWAKYRHFPRFVLPVTCLAVLAVLSVITHRQIGYWRDSVTLWAHTLQVTPHDWVADLGIGISYQQQGQLEEALEHLYRAAQDKPMDPDVNLGDNDRARECYEALRPRPAPPVPAINWHGAWWRDLGPFIRSRFRQWRSDDSSSPQSP